ncbi:MAG: hypothetical protein NVSMB57_02040 [Actinomycetota bacterium]
MNDFQRRYLEPFLLPMAGFVFVGSIAWGLSRILLATTKNGAAAVALFAAIAVLGGSAIVASRGFHLSQKFAAGLAFLGVVGGGTVFAATFGIRPIEAHVPAPSAIVHAKSPLSFEEKQIPVKDVKPVFVVRFINEDTSNPHNWQVVKSKTDQTVIVSGGAPFKGSASHDYVLKGVQAGAYYYFCQVHPGTMFGTLLVGNATAPPAAEASPSAPTSVPSKPSGKAGKGPVATTIKAQTIGSTPKFSLNVLALRANARVTIKMVNADTGIPHNLQIGADDAFSSTLFNGAIFPGPAVKAYKIPPIPAGKYPFRCIVHPQTMKGVVQFK